MVQCIQINLVMAGYIIDDEGVDFLEYQQQIKINLRIATLYHLSVPSFHLVVNHMLN